MKEEQMTAQEFDAALGALGMLAPGTLTITQKIGTDGAELETDQHPIVALFGAICGVEEMIFRAGHTEDVLKIQLDREAVERFVSELAAQIVEHVLAREEEWQKEHGDNAR